jgi:hypothetical protein
MQIGEGDQLLAQCQGTLNVDFSLLGSQCPGVLLMVIGGVLGLAAVAEIVGQVDGMFGESGPSGLKSLLSSF